MESPNSRQVDRGATETIYPSNPRPRAGRAATGDRQQIVQLKHHPGNGGTMWGGGEGAQKLKNRLTSRGIPESVVDELLEPATVISYRKGTFIFLEGAPTDLLFWVSSGLVDIL